jgi:3-dehydroquinate dehydratase-2
MIQKIYIINGPNLNLLGNREIGIYGTENLDHINTELQKKFSSLNFHFFQSNNEYELINKIQEAGINADALVINAGAFSHTSIAIADAISATTIPSISVHISNIYNREKYRHTDLISDKCGGAIIGLGTIGYQLAVDCLLEK